jgi:cation diffusion facilitator family transporter
MAESRVAIYGAIAANVAIAVTKFVVAGITGSSAMLSEGVHSVVDTGNDLLLLVGVHRSRQPASAEHPFGHGKELYFWSLIVAVLIFGVGGGVSFYEGVQHVRQPHPLEDAHWNYIVLACAAVFEGSSFLVALRQFLREKGDGPFWEALHASKDPATYTVMAEDGAALAGLAIAAVGVYASHQLGMPRLDGVASMAIGVLLAGVAILLIRESRGLLVGEGVNPDTARAIQDMARREHGVCDVGPVLSMYVGAEDVLVTFDIRFAADVPAGEVAATIKRIEHAVRERYPRVRRIFLEPVSVAADPRKPELQVPPGAADSA